MNKILEKYNEIYVRNYAGAVKGVQQDEALPSGPAMAPYKEALKEKKVLEISFDFADEKGNLSVTDANGVTVTLMAEDFSKDNQYYKPRMKSKFIGLSLNCKVSEINEKKKVVKVVSATGIDDIKGAIISSIFKELRAGRNPILWGDILFVNNRRAVVNILHRNVMGIINVKDWSKSYTRHLPEVAVKGEPVQFEVVGVGDKRKGKDFCFQLSRKNVSPDPWESLADIEEGSVLTVKCIDKPIDKTYFWGLSNRAPGIEIMCNNNPNLAIMKGVVYKCKVRRFNKGEHIFQVSPFEVVSTGIGTIENINYVTSRKKNVDTAREE